MIARVCGGYTEKSARPIRDSNQNAIPRRCASSIDICPALLILTLRLSFHAIVHILCSTAKPFLCLSILHNSVMTFFLYLTNLIPAHRVGNICSPRVSEISLRVLKQKEPSLLLRCREDLTERLTGQFHTKITSVSPGRKPASQTSMRL